MDKNIFETSGATEATAPSARADDAGDGGAVAGPVSASAQRKLSAVQRLFRGESLEAVSREVGVPVHRLTEWRDRAFAGAEGALKDRARDERMKRSRVCRPRWERSPWPTSCCTRRSTSWRAAALWPGGGRGHEPGALDLHAPALWDGPCLRRLGRFSGDGVPAASPGQCRQRSWSATSSWPARGLQRHRAARPYRRGDRSLALFRGGSTGRSRRDCRAHGVRTAARRVCRVMRENDLLAPQRPVQRDAHPHDGTIVTDRVDEVWGTDMTQTVTIGEGRAYVFIAVDHCSDDSPAPMPHQARAAGRRWNRSVRASPGTSAASGQTPPLA